MARRIESLFLTGPEGRLEALLEEPEEAAPTRAALVCHPHPLQGGTMHNKVVHRLARGFRRTGHVVLRFNFRGVNLSEGKHSGGPGEVKDAAAALAALRERYPSLPYSIAGFSFGSRIALRLSQNQAAAERVIAAGLPAHVEGIEKLVECPIERVLIHSRRDEICPPEPVQKFYDLIPGPKQLIWIDAQDHFFAGALDQVEQTVVDVLGSATSKP